MSYLCPFYLHTILCRFPDGKVQINMEKVNNKVPNNLSLSVKNKLYIGFALVAVLAAAVGVVGYTQLGAVNAEYDYILTEVVALQDCSMEMIISVKDGAEAASEYVSYAYGDSALYSEFNAANEAFDVYESETERIASEIGDSSIISAVDDTATQHEVVVVAGEDMMDEYDTISATTDDLTVILHDVDPYMHEFDEELIVLIGKLEKL